MIHSQALVALITAILTSGLTLLGVWITNRASNQRLKIQLEHERKLKNEELLRLRLEELYVVANKYLSTLVTHYFPFQMVMNGEITFNQALDLVIEKGSSKDYEPHRVTMLIDLYFPEIKPEFQKIIDVREKLNGIVDGYKNQYKTGNPDGSKWIIAFRPLLEEIAQRADAFDQHITKIKINA